MLDFSHPPAAAWPPHLQKRGDGDYDPEPFQDWWVRHRTELDHLSPLIAEQWIYRHFRETWFKFLPLETLTWREEFWSSNRLLNEVHLERDELTPKEDYLRFNQYKIDTALDFNENLTWTIPPVVLEAPAGIVTWNETELADVRFVVIEGHKQFRYLAGTFYEGIESGPHSVFIINSPIA